MQLPDDVFVPLEFGNADEEIGEFSLVVAIGRECTEHSGDDTHWPHPLETKIQAERFTRIT